MRARRHITPVLVFVVFLLASHIMPPPASAHPHVWVTMETEIVYDKAKAITGVRHKWTFDEFYTSFAIQGLDKNGDGVYSREELSELAQVNITSLKEFEYFTFPKIGKTVLARMEPRDYYLEHDSGRITLYLTVPFENSVTMDQMKDFSLTVYDPSFYVDFAFAKNSAVRLLGAPATCSATIKNPAPQSTPVQMLGEAFFTNADATAELAARYAKTIYVACPSS